MKTSEKSKQSDYLLLYTILDYYTKNCISNASLAPRYFKMDTISDIVEPFEQLKLLLQRIEWLDNDEYVFELLDFMNTNEISVEELRWAVDMFVLNKQNVLYKIESLL